MNFRIHAVLALALSLLASVVAVAADPQWNIMKPSTTGIPGEEVRLMAFDPQGNLWVGGRWPFWGECGLAMLSADQLPYEQLQGGGFDTGAWKVWSNVQNPIPSPYLSDIEFAPDGIIWLASDGGLTRFNPNAKTPQDMWFTYNHANSPLIMDSVRSIDMDSQGNLWLTNVSVQFSTGALFKFNPSSNQWTQYMVGQQLPWSPPWYDVNAVHVGLSGKVYVTHSTLGGFAEFNGTTWTLHSNGLPLEGILEDLQGNVWFTSSQYGLIKWNGTSFSSFNLGSQGTITALGMDPLAGVVYAGSWYGDIFKMVNGTTAQFLFNADNIPGSIYFRPNGEIWISNYGGNGTLGTVRQYTANGQLLERMNTYNSGLPDYFIENIQSDSAGNMWFACGEGGLSRMLGSNGAADTPTHWRNWGNHNDLSEPYPFAGNEPMYAMFEDSQGDIWMGGNGVARWDPKADQFTGFWNWSNSALGVDDMLCFAQQPDGTMWVGCGYAGAFHLDSQTNDWVQHTWGPPGWTVNEIVDMTTDSVGNLWILTYVQLHRLTPQGVWTTWDSSNSPMTLGSLFDLEPARAVDGGGIWIGMQGKMLHFDGTTWTTITKVQAGWPGANVNGISIRPSDGRVAVTTQDPNAFPYTGGISVLEANGSWTHYTTANSPLTHWQVSAAKFDAQGNLWASAMSEGVVQIMIGTAPVIGDVTGDGIVNTADLLAVINAWGSTCPAPPVPCPADLNHDGTVNAGDLLIILNNWS